MAQLGTGQYGYQSGSAADLLSASMDPFSFQNMNAAVNNPVVSNTNNTAFGPQAATDPTRGSFNSGVTPGSARSILAGSPTATAPTSGTPLNSQGLNGFTSNSTPAANSNTFTGAQATMMPGFTQPFSVQTLPFQQWMAQQQGAAPYQQNYIAAQGDPMNGQVVPGTSLNWNNLTTNQKLAYQYASNYGLPQGQDMAAFLQANAGDPNAAYNQSYAAQGMGNASPEGQYASLVQTWGKAYADSMFPQFAGSQTSVPTAPGQNPILKAGPGTTQAAANAAQAPGFSSNLSSASSTIPLLGTQGTQPPASQPLAQTAQGANPTSDTQSQLSNYIMGLLMQSLFGQQQSQPTYSTTTTPLGYTQYQQNTPQQQDPYNSLQAMLALAMLNQMTGGQQTGIGNVLGGGR